MATFTKKLLSGSTNGKQVKITATTSGAAVTLHTAVAGTGSLDEVFIYATNTSNAPVSLTILWGGTSTTDNAITIQVPSLAGRVLICDGMLLQNSLVISAFAATASVILIDGFVNNIA